jgi:ABC-type uncharacterized transport system permease subunit
LNSISGTLRAKLQIFAGIGLLAFAIYGVISGRTLFGSRYHGHWVTFESSPAWYVLGECLFFAAAILAIRMGIRSQRASRGK